MVQVERSRRVYVSADFETLLVSMSNSKRALSPQALFVLKLSPQAIFLSPRALFVLGRQAGFLGRQALFLRNGNERRS